MDLASSIVLLLTIMDPVGNVPNFIAGTRGVAPDRRLRVIGRELLIALALMLAFLFGGPWFLRMLHLSGEAILIGGSLMLFLIAIRMIFPGENQAGKVVLPESEPFIVPLATPLVAGPSVLASLLVMSSSDPRAWGRWLLATTCAWSVTAAVLMCAPWIARKLGDRGTIAVERLMGMILVMISVQMFLDGLSLHWPD
jgi:multiple antibiotic resistance protein